MWYNAFIVALLRSPLHGLLSKGMLLISYRGRRSGKPYTVPVNFIREGDILLVTSYRNRTWWRNLRGDGPVTVRIHGRDWPATAEVLEAQEPVADAFGRYLKAMPQVAKYLGVRVDADGRPDGADLHGAAHERVVVRIVLALPRAEQGA